MAAIASGTVVRWEVANPRATNERIRYKDSIDVSVYVGDEAQEADAASAIISKYILSKIGEAPPASPPTQADADRLKAALELLQEGRNGLLRVVGATRASVTPPPVP
jgi:hypothetical protein